MSGVLVNFEDITIGIDATDLAKLLVIIDDREVLLLVGFETLGNSLGVVIGTALATSEEAFNAYFLTAVKE